MNVWTELHFSDRQYLRSVLVPPLDCDWLNWSGFWIEQPIGGYRIPVAPKPDGWELRRVNM